MQATYTSNTEHIEVADAMSIKWNKTNYESCSICICNREKKNINLREYSHTFALAFGYVPCVILEHNWTHIPLLSPEISFYFFSFNGRYMRDCGDCIGVHDDLRLYDRLRPRHRMFYIVYIQWEQSIGNQMLWSTQQSDMKNKWKLLMFLVIKTVAISKFSFIFINGSRKLSSKWRTDNW